MEIFLITTLVLIVISIIFYLVKNKKEIKKLDQEIVDIKNKK
jgi:short subunit fatty acids transporter